MPTRKKTAAPAVVEAPAPEATAEPWDEAGWDLDSNAKALAEAANGDFVPGDINDVQALQVQKSAESQAVMATLAQVEARLQQSMLLANPRASERTTAEEIRLMAMELDAGLGSIHAILTADSSADQEFPKATETLEELMAEVGDPDPGDPPPEPPQPDPPPEPRGPISLLIAPGPDRCGAVVSLDAPDLDSGEWLEAKFRMLDNWVFTPEGGDPTRVDAYQLEQLAFTPIRFLFHGKTGIAREYLADQANCPAPLCIVPHAFSLAGVGVNSPNGYVEVRALDGEVPVLEVRGKLAPGVS